MTEITVALVQFTSTQDPEVNLEKFKKIMRESKGRAQLIVFPEYTDFVGPITSREELYEVSDRQEFLNEVRIEAKNNNISVIIGIYERGLKPNVYSTAYFILPDGEILGKYSKSHLFNAYGFSEFDVLTPSNDRPRVFEFMNFKFGLIICYEIRFPELARRAALDGADAMVVPSAWYKGFNKEDQWETLVKARSMENTMYVITSNQIGNTFTGITMASDPAGIAISRATEDEGVIYVKISKERIERVRENMPLLRQRRPELY